MEMTFKEMKEKFEISRVGTDRKKGLFIATDRQLTIEEEQEVKNFFYTKFGPKNINIENREKKNKETKLWIKFSIVSRSVDKVYYYREIPFSSEEEEEILTELCMDMSATFHKVPKPRIIEFP